jgi:ribulose 1,5-bisphosphate synthetase/thiazole synthase
LDNANFDYHARFKMYVQDILSLLAASYFIQTAAAGCTRVITKDVAIIGGGASGAHAAVRLREDFGKSVVVVEKADRLVNFHSYNFSLSPA